MEIRVITANDIDKCTEIFVEAYNQEPWSHNWSLEKAKEYILSYFDNPRLVGFVFLDDNGIAAAILARKRPWWSGDLLFIDEIFVSPDRQHSGYGKQLMTYAEQYARDNNISVISLMTNDFMPAFQFYRNIGFQKADQFAFMFKTL